MGQNLDQKTTNTSEFLYHYTSLSSFMGILQCNGAEKGHKTDLCFWGSRFDCMNDAYDCQYALQYAIKVAQHNSINVQRTISPYVVSFCKDKDSLNMWRLYRSYICLILDKGDIQNNKDNNILHDCLYPENEEIESLISLFLSEIVKVPNSTLWKAIQMMAAFVKHSGFEVENECRFVHFYQTMNETDDAVQFRNGTKLVCSKDTDSNNKLSFRTDNNNLIPYHKFYIPKKALKGIIVREYDDEKFERAKEHIQLMLHKVEITDLDENIEKSSACKIN